MAEEDKTLDRLTDDDCADYILTYLRKFGKKDRVFSRILLRMIERDGVRETARGLITCGAQGSHLEDSRHS
jgi:hypothetical protein